MSSPSSSSTTTTKNTPSSETIVSVLSKLLSCIQRPKKTTTTTHQDGTNPVLDFQTELQTLGPPSVPLSLLVPHLFPSSPEEPPTTNDTTQRGNHHQHHHPQQQQQSFFSSSEALCILTYLATHHSSTFAIPISHSVRIEIEKRSTDDDVPIVLSDGVLDAITLQLTNPQQPNETVTNTECALLTLSRTKYNNNNNGYDPSTTEHRSIPEQIVSSLLRTYQHLCSNHRPSTDRNVSVITARFASLLVSIMDQLPPPSSPRTVVEDGVVVVVWNSALDAFLLSPLLEPNVDEDPLLASTILDEMERLSTINDGEEGWLSRVRDEWIVSKALRPLLRLAGDGDDVESPHFILGGSVVRVLSSLYRCISRSGLMMEGEEGLRNGFRRVLRSFAQNARGEMDHIVVVDAVSTLASSSEDCLIALLDDDDCGCGEEEEKEEIFSLCDQWLDFANAPRSKSKAMVVCSLALVIDPLSSAALNESSKRRVYIPSSELSLRLIRRFGTVNSSSSHHSQKHDAVGGTTTTTPELDLILSMIKSPFVEVRLASFELTRAMITRIPTGAVLLLSQPGFLDVLLRKGGEGGDKSTREEEEGRVGAVRAVLKSSARVMLNDKAVEELERVVRNGMFGGDTWGVGDGSRN